MNVVSSVLFLQVISAFASDQCQTDVDCQMNGKCTSKVCVCRLPWSGPSCAELVRLPADISAGYDSPHGSDKTTKSSWGGSILLDEHGGLYHMYAAEMLNDCGIDYWEPNSRVVHSVSHSPEGPFNFSDVVIAPFAHEPNAVRAPTGEWVIFATVRHPDGTPLENCTRKTISRSGNTYETLRGRRKGGNIGRKRMAGAQFEDSDDPPPPRHTYMTYSKSPYGPWTEPVMVLKANHSLWSNRSVLIDTNLAVAIKADGSAVGIWRKCENVPAPSPCSADCCTFPHLLTASDWKKPETYIPQSGSDGRLFPEITSYGAEDPMVWISEDSTIHAILHDEQGPNRCTAFGRHAFAVDGFV